MEFKDFEGKVIVRTKAMVRNGFMDRSFMGDPIHILKVEGKVAIYKDKYSSIPNIMPADYIDEHWQLIPEEYQSQFKK